MTENEHATGDEDSTWQLMTLRDAIGVAIRRGEVPAIAAGYLGLAAALAADDKFGAAMRELEEGIDVLVGGSASAGEYVGLLLFASSKLYLETGDTELARRVSATTDRQQVRRFAAPTYDSASSDSRRQTRTWISPRAGRPFVGCQSSRDR